VLSKPGVNASQILLVNVTTYKKDADVDNSCILEVGDHRFITRPSFILYRKAVFSNLELLSRGIEKRVLVPDIPVTEELLRRILHGAAKSPFLSRKYLNLLREQGLI